MTEQDIVTIEGALSIRLPQAYRDVACPFRVRAFIGNKDTHLWDDALALIELNRELRLDKNWPSHLFAIGAMDDGASMAIDLNSPAFTVWWIDRAFTAPGTAPGPDGFVNWSAAYLQELRSGELMDGFDPENDPPGTRGQIVPLTFRQR